MSRAATCLWRAMKDRCQIQIERLQVHSGPRTRLAMYLGLLAQPTGLPEIEILPVARRTVDHMLPLLLVLDILVSRGPRRKISKAISFRTTAPFGVGICSLHSLLILSLQAIPMIFRRFSIHVRR